MAKISKGIVITTSNYTEKFLADCAKSCGNKYPILIVTNDYKGAKCGEYCHYKHFSAVTNDWNGFELGGIMRGKEYFDEFIHLMDTCIIKDTSLFDKLFDIEGNVFLTEGGYHYKGKFVSNSLPDIPKITSKAEAIAQELYWYRGARTYFKPDLPVHTNVFEEIHGQKRMRLENDFIIKWKGTYHI